jgi:hypothetical protein
MSILLALFLTLPGVNNLGDRIIYTDARSLSLGGISSVINSGKNPASFGFINRISGSITPSYTRTNEHRGLRVYDSYGNNIGISTIANSTGSNIGIAAGSVVIPIKSFRVGFQYSPLWAFNYYYRREYRDDFFQLFRIETHEYTGSIYSLAPALSFSYKFFIIGIKEDFIQGKKDALITVVEPYQPDSVIRQSGCYEGRATRAGIIILADRHLALAYSYLTEHTVDCEGTSIELNYPASHTIGCFYQPAARIPTRFYGEYCREVWPTAINIYKIGIEHIIVQDYSIRYGFCVFPDYAQDAVWTTILSIGGGYRTKRLHFDIAYSDNRRDYSNNDFTGLENLGNIQIDESSSIFLISLSFIL